MRGARVALAGGLAAVAVALALVLSHPPAILARPSAIEQVNTILAIVPGAGSGCQAGETLPAHTSAIRLSLESSAGPRVAVTVRAGQTVVAHGESAPGWLGKVVTIPVEPLDRTVPNTTVCFAFTGAEERVYFLGVLAPRRGATRTSVGLLQGRMAIEYLRAGNTSWWSLAHSTARRLGLGRAWAGTWIALLVASLMASSIVLASWLTLRESR
ncbi:MAG TPA: hypothetical protein VGL57_08090 [Solirubrobacteraceae bacterium]|jgi:hypothetical protein